MLDLFRKRGVTSVIYGGIIIAIVIVFVLQFRPGAGENVGSLRETCAATVRGRCIDPKDLNGAFRAIAPRDPQTGQIQQARARAMNARRIALEGLVERELLVAEAERLGLTVSDDEINDAIYNGIIRVSLPSDNPSLAGSLGVYDGMRAISFRDPKTKEFELKVYERTIRNFLGRSPAEFREEQEREILAAKMRDLVRAPVRVSDTEAFESYTRERSTATLTYVPVKRSWLMRYLPAPTAAQIDAALKDTDKAAAIDAQLKTRMEEDAPKENHIRHILVKTPPGASDDERKAALARLAGALQRLQAGEPFSEVARAISDDTGSAMRGGDVGDKTDGFVEPFKKAADALKPGETTATAIETQFGYHLIRKDDPSKPLDEAALRRSIARELVLKEKAEDAAREAAKAISEALKGGKTADEAVQAVVAPYVKAGAPLPTLNVTRAEEGGSGPTSAPARALSADADPDRPQAQTSRSVNRGGDPIPEISGEAAVKISAFAFEAKPGTVYDEPLQADDGFVVVQLKEGKAATREDFDKERDVYTQTLLANKQQEALALYVKRVREANKQYIKIDESFVALPKETTPFDDE